MANQREKTKEQRIRAEKARLKKLYRNLPKEAAGTVAGLIDQAAFMRIECEDMADDLRENGWTVQKSAALKASFPLTYAECVKSEV